MKAPRAHRAVLHRVADEDELQVVFLGQLEQPDRVLMAEHRGFIDDDPAAAAAACIFSSSRKWATVLASKPSFASTPTASAVVAR